MHIDTKLEVRTHLVSRGNSAITSVVYNPRRDEVVVCDGHALRAFPLRAALVASRVELVLPHADMVGTHLFYSRRENQYVMVLRDLELMLLSADLQIVSRENHRQMSILAAAFSQAQQLLAITGGKGEVRIYGIERFAKNTLDGIVRLNRFALRRTITSEHRWMTAAGLAINEEEGHVLAAQGASVLAWDMASGELLLKLDELHATTIRAIAVLPGDRHLLTTSYDGQVKRWALGASRSTGRPELVEATACHGKEVRGLACDPKGRLWFSCADDLAVKVWHAERGAELDAHVPSAAVASSSLGLGAHGCPAPSHIAYTALPGSNGGGGVLLVVSGPLLTVLRVQDPLLRFCALSDCGTRAQIVLTQRSAAAGAGAGAGEGEGGEEGEVYVLSANSSVQRLQLRTGGLLSMAVPKRLRVSAGEGRPLGGAPAAALDAGRALAAIPAASDSDLTCFLPAPALGRGLVLMGSHAGALDVVDMAAGGRCVQTLADAEMAVPITALALVRAPAGWTCTRQRHGAGSGLGKAGPQTPATPEADGARAVAGAGERAGALGGFCVLTGSSLGHISLWGAAQPDVSRPLAAHAAGILALIPMRVRPRAPAGADEGFRTPRAAEAGAARAPGEAGAEEGRRENVELELLGEWGGPPLFEAEGGAEPAEEAQEAHALLSVARDGAVRLWDMRGLQCAPRGSFLGGAAGIPCTAALVQPDGRVLLGFDNGSLEEWTLLPSALELLRAEAEGAQPDGRQSAGGAPSPARQASSLLRIARRSRGLEPHAQRVTALSPSFCNEHFLSASLDCSVLVWRARGCEALRVLTFAQPVTQALFCDGGGSALVLLGDVVLKVSAEQLWRAREAEAVQEVDAAEPADGAEEEALHAGAATRGAPGPAREAAAHEAAGADAQAVAWTPPVLRRTVQRTGGRPAWLEGALLGTSAPGSALGEVSRTLFGLAGSEQGAPAADGSGEAVGTASDASGEAEGAEGSLGSRTPPGLPRARAAAAGRPGSALPLPAALPEAGGGGAGALPTPGGEGGGGRVRFFGEGGGEGGAGGQARAQDAAEGAAGQARAQDAAEYNGQLMAAHYRKMHYAAIGSSGASPLHRSRTPDPKSQPRPPREAAPAAGLQGARPPSRELGVLEGTPAISRRAPSPSTGAPLDRPRTADPRAAGSALLGGAVVQCTSSVVELELRLPARFRPAGGAHSRPTTPSSLAALLARQAEGPLAAGAAALGARDAGAAQPPVPPAGAGAHGALGASERGGEEPGAERTADGAEAGGAVRGLDGGSVAAGGSALVARLVAEARALAEAAQGLTLVEAGGEGEEGAAAEALAALSAQAGGAPAAAARAEGEGGETGEGTQADTLGLPAAAEPQAAGAVGRALEAFSAEVRQLAGARVQLVNGDCLAQMSDGPTRVFAVALYGLEGARARARLALASEIAGVPMHKEQVLSSRPASGAPARPPQRAASRPPSGSRPAVPPPGSGSRAPTAPAAEERPAPAAKRPARKDVRSNKDGAEEGGAQKGSAKKSKASGRKEAPAGTEAAAVVSALSALSALKAEADAAAPSSEPGAQAELGEAATDGAAASADDGAEAEAAEAGGEPAGSMDGAAGKSTGVSALDTRAPQAGVAPSLVSAAGREGGQGAADVCARESAAADAPGSTSRGGGEESAADHAAGGAAGGAARQKLPAAGKAAQQMRSLEGGGGLRGFQLRIPGRAVLLRVMPLPRQMRMPTHLQPLSPTPIEITRLTGIRRTKSFDRTRAARSLAQPRLTRRLSVGDAPPRNSVPIYQPRRNNGVRRESSSTAPARRSAALETGEEEDDLSETDDDPAQPGGGGGRRGWRSRTRRFDPFGATAGVDAATLSENLTDAAGGARSNAAQLAAPAGAISKPSIWSSWAESKVITEYEEDSDASIDGLDFESLAPSAFDALLEYRELKHEQSFSFGLDALKNAAALSKAKERILSELPPDGSSAGSPGGHSGAKEVQHRAHGSNDRDALAEEPASSAGADAGQGEPGGRLSQLLSPARLSSSPPRTRRASGSDLTHGWQGADRQGTDADVARERLASAPASTAGSLGPTRLDLKVLRLADELQSTASRVLPQVPETPRVVKYSLLPATAVSASAVAFEERLAEKRRAERDQLKQSRKPPLPLAVRPGLPRAARLARPETTGGHPHPALVDRARSLMSISR